MKRQAASILTVLALSLLLLKFPVLVEHWIIVIAKAIPSAFTLGMSTVLIYKGLRYPRGSIFTLLGLLQILFVGWIIWLTIQSQIAWLSVPILIGAIVMAPQSAKATWKWLKVDKYYQKNSQEQFSKGH